MDPFQESIVWSTVSLVGWFTAAAALGDGLRRLGTWSRRGPAPKRRTRPDAGIPEAA